MEVQFNKNSADASIVTGPITIIGNFNKLTCTTCTDSTRPQFHFFCVCIVYDFVTSVTAVEVDQILICT